MGRKPCCSRKEMPKATPKGMAKEKEKAKTGRAGKVTRVTRIRIARATRPVFIAIRKGIRSGTARA